MVQFILDMRLIWILAFFVVLANAETPKDTFKKRYDNFSVYKLNIRSKLQLSLINKFCAQSLNCNIWKNYDDYSRQVHVMVNPFAIPAFQLFLKVYAISHELFISNVQNLIDNEAAANERAAPTFGWTRYHNLADIENWLDELLAMYPEVTEGFIIGKSYEGRNIRGLKISYKPNNPGVFIESTIHAHEWIASTTATWLINQLLSSKDDVIRELAESHDWYIVPVLNVDGFVYSHEKDRLWRKTRQPSETSSCIGVDPNRNFDVNWMENGGASDDPCEWNYAGTHPFSTPEIKSMAEYLGSIKNKVNVLLAFHSYSQLVMSPYGHTSEETPDNYEDLMKAAKAYVDAVKALPYETVYNYGSAAGTLGLSSGTTSDWAYKEGIKMSYILEFRDTGHFGFVLPPAFIVPNAEETLIGIMALLAECKKLGYLAPK